MKKLLLVAALTGLFVSPAAMATPLIPASTAKHVAVQSDDIIQVKKKGKARPHGWSQGRKIGWRGRGLPPGQAKKMR
jgi:hypothetical protein